MEEVGMKIVLVGKSLSEVVGYLKTSGNKPCADSGMLDCPNECSSYISTDETYIHEKYDIDTYLCASCGSRFFQVSEISHPYGDFETKDGVQEGLV
jgi:hypothetical protein